jgi:hypothetical protein
MGGVFDTCSGCTDYCKGVVMHEICYRFLMVLLLIFGLAMVVKTAPAAALPMQLPPTVVSTAGGYATAPAANAPVFNGGAFPGGMTAQVAGRTITAPAAWRFAANAGRFAATAVRLTPTGLVTTAVLMWLLPHGIKWVEDKWMVDPAPAFPGDSPGTGYHYGNEAFLSPTPKEAWDKVCLDWWNSKPNYHQSFVYEAIISPEGNGTLWVHWKGGGNDQYPYLNVPLKRKLDAYPVIPTPATDADWNKVFNAPLTDAAANDLANRGVAIPLSPQINPQRQVVPLSDPYIDPVTGKPYRDVGYLTPNPANPMTADWQVVKQEVDANGDPVTDPDTGQQTPPQENKDQCLETPNRLGCMEWGDAPDVPDLQNSEKTISITPQGGFGPDSAACPADLTASFLGQPLSMSFKPVCDGADMFRPIIIGMAWLSAILIALGVGRRGD